MSLGIRNRMERNSKGSCINPQQAALGCASRGEPSKKQHDGNKLPVTGEPPNQLNSR